MYALYNIQEQHISAALKPANIVFHSLLVFREFSQWYSDEVASRLFTNHAHEWQRWIINATRKKDNNLPTQTAEVSKFDTSNLEHAVTPEGS